MKKLIDDTLKTPNGKWSRKSILAVLSYFIAVLLGIFIVISDKVLEREVNRYAIDVFNSFLLFAATLLGISLLDKKVLNKAEDEAPS